MKKAEDGLSQETHQSGNNRPQNADPEAGVSRASKLKKVSSKFGIGDYASPAIADEGNDDDIVAATISAASTPLKKTKKELVKNFADPNGWLRIRPMKPDSADTKPVSTPGAFAVSGPMQPPVSSQSESHHHGIVPGSVPSPEIISGVSTSSDEEIATATAASESTPQDISSSILRTIISSELVQIDMDEAVPVTDESAACVDMSGSTAMMVMAEPSSEESLRRRNKRLVVGIVGLILLFLVVAGIVIGVFVADRGNDSKAIPDTTPGANGGTSSAPSSSPSAPPRPTFSPVAWESKGQVLLGNSTRAEFGRSVSLSGSGDILAVGAWGYDYWSGQVRVFRFENASQRWEPFGMPPLSGREPGNQLGVSVDLSANGTMLVAGENQYNQGETANRSGLVRVFRYEDGGTWGQVGPDIKGIADGDQFGWDVKMSSDGGIVAASARRHGNRTGFLRVFQLNETQPTEPKWRQMGRTLFGEVVGDQFGTSLALSSDGLTVASGADENDVAGLNAGHVRAFRFIDGDWSQLGQTLVATAAKDDFGYSLAMDATGSVLAVGAWEHQETLGYVRIFELDAGNETWHQMGSTIYGDVEGGQFGISVDLSANGTVLVIGANEYNFGQKDKPGRASVHRYDGFDWYQVGQDLTGDVADDRFGWKVALSAEGTTLAVSAYRNDANAERSGQVQVLQVTGNV